MTGPLSGVRVVEVAGFVFVPMATAILADLGADVVKVEPLTGDSLLQLLEGDPVGLAHVDLAAPGRVAVWVDE